MKIRPLHDRVLVKRLEERQGEKDQYTEVMGRAEAIETAHQAWLTAKEELERWEGIANQFREQEAQRNAPLAEIQAEQARLEQELKSLQEQQAGMLSLQHEIESLQPQIESTETTKTIAEAKLDRRDRLQTDVQESKLALAEIEKENKFLQQEMNDLKARIDKLRATEEAICPTCGRMLNTPERLGLIDQLNEEGAVLGDRYRDNQAIIKETKQKEADIHQQLKELGNVDAELRALEQKLTQLTSRLEHFQSQLRAWEANGAPRLERTIRTLAEEAYAQESRRQHHVGHDSQIGGKLTAGELHGDQSQEGNPGASDQDDGGYLSVCLQESFHDHVEVTFDHLVNCRIPMDGVMFFHDARLVHATASQENGWQIEIQ